MGLERGDPGPPPFRTGPLPASEGSRDGAGSTVRPGQGSAPGQAALSQGDQGLPSCPGWRGARGQAASSLGLPGRFLGKQLLHMLSPRRGSAWGRQPRLHTHRGPGPSTPHALGGWPAPPQRGKARVPPSPPARARLPPSLGFPGLHSATLPAAGTGLPAWLPSVPAAPAGPRSLRPPARPTPALWPACLPSNPSSTPHSCGPGAAHTAPPASIRDPHRDRAQEQHLLREGGGDRATGHTRL